MEAPGRNLWATLRIFRGENEAGGLFQHPACTQPTVLAGSAVLVLIPSLPNSLL